MAYVCMLIWNLMLLCWGSYAVFVLRESAWWLLLAALLTWWPDEDEINKKGKENERKN